MTRAGIVTQARTTSTRLPRKVLLEAGGKTLLDHHLDRLVTSGFPVYVATTANPSDDPIVEIAEEVAQGVHRGSETDVLSRFDEAATVFDLDVVVRVTSDCPLIDGALIASALREFIDTGDPCLYLSNTLERSFPRGFDFEIFSASALACAAANASEPAEREHVTPFLYANHDGRMQLRNILWSDDKSRYRVTLDTTDDLTLIRRLIEEYGAASLSCEQIIGVLDTHPELVEINAHVEQKKLSE